MELIKKCGLYIIVYIGLCVVVTGIVFLIWWILYSLFGNLETINRAMGKTLLWSYIISIFLVKTVVDVLEKRRLKS